MTCSWNTLASEGDRERKRGRDRDRDFAKGTNAVRIQVQVQGIPPPLADETWQDRIGQDRKMI